MDLIDDHTVDEIHHAISLACDDVPLLRGRDDDVTLLNLLLCHAHIASEFADLDTKVVQRRLELVNDF